ncbi:hypothetical protein AB0758_47870 [Tolypothrix bouteillei VB521301_2]|uniref:hypothetical protein n=1 Tax=Tolypothrix bouteillei TaxID=1246981 RepID=UPI0038B5C4F5
MEQEFWWSWTVAKFVTGINLPTETQKLTPLRRIKKCKRQVDWREVRVGLARPVEQKDQRTFIARMGQYPEVVSQLKTAAIDRGLSTYTLVYGVADGGNGLREALSTEFNHFQFILDRAHLKQHIYATSEEMKFSDEMRSFGLNISLILLIAVMLKKVISRLKRWQGEGQKSVSNLSKYLFRFQDAVHYNKYRSMGLPIGSGEVESTIVIFHKATQNSWVRLGILIQLIQCLLLRVIQFNHWWSRFFGNK